MRTPSRPWHAPDRPAGPLVRPADVGGRVAWDALLREGVLGVVWGSAARPADLPPGPLLRALAIAEDLPSGAVVARASAVWLLAGGTAGERLTVAVAPGAHRPRADRWRVHEAALHPQEVTWIGPVPVTSPARTAVDVAAWEPRARARTLLAALSASSALEDGAVDAVLRRLSGHRNVARARRLLRDVRDEPGPGQSADSAALEPVTR